MNHRIADTIAPLEVFRKNGYYTVGDNIYSHKITALEQASKSNQEISWNFNNELFESIDWKIPVATSINDLYKMRAQQLRDQYDHLVLLYSGGADSTVILKAFLDNGIHLDEIIYDGPFAQMMGKYKASKNPDPTNIISEWDFAAKPMLDSVSKNFPRTKITLIDSTEKLETEDTDDTCTLTLAHNYVIVKRHRLVDQRLREISEKITKNVALIPGVDKPYIVIKHNVLCCTFDDNRCFVKSDYTNDFHRYVEYFYWTPDLPEVAIKQAQLIYQAIQLQPSIRYFFDNTMTTAAERADPIFREQCRNLVSEIVYPSWDRSTFQALKSDSIVNSLHFKWATDIKDIAIESWRSSVNARVNTIDNKYLNRRSDNSLLSYRSFHPRRLYPVGILPKLKEI